MGGCCLLRLLEELAPGLGHAVRLRATRKGARLECAGDVLAAVEELYGAHARTVLQPLLALGGGRGCLSSRAGSEGGGRKP